MLVLLSASLLVSNHVGDLNKTTVGQEYVKNINVLNSFNSAPQDGILDEFETVSAFASGGVGTVTLTRTTTDVFSGAGAMNVAITATGTHSPNFRRILPFPQQRYITMEFAVGQRAGNVATKQVTFDVAYYSNNKNGRFRFAIQDWDNDIVDFQVYNSVTTVYDTIETDITVPFEGKTFFIVKAMIDTFDRKWVSLEIAGERYDLSAYGLETITDATLPDAVQAALLVVTAQSLTVGNTINMVMDKFKWVGTTYPQ